MSIFTDHGIPSGWKRGEELNVKNLNGKNLATIAIISRRYIGLIGKVEMVDVGYLTVHADQQDEANEWLEWWRS